MKVTTEDFIKKANIVHNEKYIYLNTKYTLHLEKVIITCPIHGDFKQTPRYHLLGQGCPDCGVIQRGKSRRNKETEVIERMVKVHDNFYDYSLVEYKRLSDKIKIICPKHGTFEQTPHNHLRGRGCPVCANIKRNKRFFNEPTLLYVVKIIKNDEVFYKVGITLNRRGIKSRFDEEDFIVEPIFTVVYNTGEEAYINEQFLLNYYKEYKYRGYPFLKKGGDGEVLTLNITEDKTFKTIFIKEENEKIS